MTRTLRKAFLYGTVTLATLLGSASFSYSQDKKIGKETPASMEEAKEEKSSLGAPGYELHAEFVDENQQPQAAPANTSALDQLVKDLKEQVKQLEERASAYFSSHQASLGISEGFEQIDNNYGLFTGVDLTLKLDDWIAIKGGMQVSYATTPFSRTKAKGDSGVTSLNKHLQERWSYNRTETQSYDNALSWALQVVLGSLDHQSFGVKGLNTYLALGGKVRLVQDVKLTEEQRASQLLYRGAPREPLHHQSSAAESTLVPYFVPTAGIGVCYSLAEGVDFFL